MVGRFFIEQAVSVILDEAEALDGEYARKFFTWFSAHIHQENRCLYQRQVASIYLTEWLTQHAMSAPVFFVEYILILSKTNTQDDIYAIKSK